MDKVFQQHQNVVLPFAKRGNLDREYVQPVVEVRAKCPVCNGGFQIAISCRYYADIDFDGLRAADAFEFTFLQHPQECNLSVQRHLADFVQEMVPPFASSNRPRRRCIAPVNAPFSWPKSSEEISDGARAAQLTLTKARCDRRDRLWMARATSSLPVPVSPLTRTLESVGATFTTRESTSCNADEVPTISSNMNAWSICSLSTTFSSCS